MSLRLLITALGGLVHGGALAGILFTLVDPRAAALPHAVQAAFWMVAVMPLAWVLGQALGRSAPAATVPADAEDPE